jgi:hypothetical protein
MVAPGRLYDLDEMVLRCHGPSAKDYIEEALVAYKAGAFRSCIIATWIAVYFDLVDKLRVHASAEVEEAQKWMAQYDRACDEYEPAKYNTAAPLLRKETEILDKCARTEIGIISKVERHDLYRLRDDRNRCAHPTVLNDVDKFVPSAELARLHLRTAIESVLSKPPIPGRLMAERLVSHCRHEYFPSDVEQARKDLEDRFGSAFDDDVLTLVADALLVDILDSETPPTARRQRTAAVDAIYQLSASGPSSSLKRKIRDLATISDPHTWWIAVDLLNHLRWAWDVLEESQKALFERVVGQVDVEDASGAGAVIEAMSIDALSAIARGRVQDLPPATLDMYADGLPSDHVKIEVLRRFEASINWRTSERLFSLLMKRSELLEDDAYTISVLEHAANNDQVFTAPKFIDLMKHLIISRPLEIPSEELRRGIRKVLVAMAKDHRVLEEDLKPLAASAAFLLGVDVDVKDEL